jgi:MOSC domain-containing protein YiiM
MNLSPSPALPARVASLHLHPPEPGVPLQTVQSVEAVEGKGILHEPRYFAKISGSTGEPSRRQVSLIEREQIAEHAAALGLPSIPPGAVRANVETTGLNLVSSIGKKIQIGEAILLIYEARQPCEKMDAICSGLRRLMANNRQGVLAEVVRSGRIQVGDPVSVVAESP